MTGTTRAGKSRKIAVASALVAAAGFFGVSRARADLALELRPSSGTTVQAGQAAPLELWLTGERTAIVASVELELTSFPTGGAPAYVAQTPNIDGFAESIAVNAHLANVTDGSLLDNSFLGFAAGTGATGVPVGGDDLFLGSFWLATPAGVPGNHRVDIISAELLDAAVTPIPVQIGGTAVNAVVPEPSALTLFALSAAAMRSRRRPRTAGH